MKKFDLTDLVVKGTLWFSSLALLNLCWLLFSLPIFTIIPSTDAVFEVLNQWENEERPTHVFQSFKHAFFKNFKSSYKWGIPFVLVSLILMADLYLLSQLTMTSPVFQILKFAFYTFAVLLVLAVLYALPIMKRTGKFHIRLLVVGLMAAVLNPLVSLAVLASFVALYFIYSIWPSMLFFFAMSSIAYLMTKAVSYIYNKEEKQQISNVN